MRLEFFLLACLIGNRLEAATETRALKKVRPETSRGAPQWAAMLKRCSIVWFIHIPKTAGTSVRKVLSTTTSDEVLYHNMNQSKKRSYAYVHHGRNHRWDDPDLLALARHDGRRVVADAETPIADLERRGYPWLNETCFFSIVREPHAWILSAENHMRVASNYRGGIEALLGGPRSGRYGYFDHDDIQSYSVGYGADPGAANICVATIDRFADIARAIYPGRASNVSTLPHANVRSHEANVTDVVQRAVRARYARDLELWKLVVEEGGLWCRTRE